MFLCILECVLCPSRPSVINGNHPGAAVNHPFVSDLEAGTAVSFANILHNVRRCQDTLIPFFPFLGPDFSKPSKGLAQIRCIGAPASRSRKTISAAQMSTPRAMPEMNVTKPSFIACRISASSHEMASFSDIFSFSGRCPVKQQRCSLFSCSVIINRHLYGSELPLTST